MILDLRGVEPQHLAALAAVCAEARPTPLRRSILAAYHGDGCAPLVVETSREAAQLGRELAWWRHRLRHRPALADALNAALGEVVDAHAALVAAERAPLAGPLAPGTDPEDRDDAWTDLEELG
jgi:hypothetical protein